MSATVVLVHGAWADGSGYRGVYDQLKAAGVDVVVAQNPTTSLATDATVVGNQIDAIGGPVVLVGHSYGGAVITEAGTHDQVKALVYLTAFGPETGESIASLIGTFPEDGPLPPVNDPVNGFITLDVGKFPASFAADVPAEQGEFLANSQVPFGVEALQAGISEPAWKSKPSWYLHVTDDQMIPESVQMRMAERMGATVKTVPGDHAIYVSNPKACVELIQNALASLDG